MPFWKTYKVPRSRVLEDSTEKNGLHHAIFTIRGNTYSGEWRDNKKHGKGKFLSKSHNYLYEGEWKDGKKSGYGILSKILNDGSRTLVVEGTWVNGKPEGDVRKHYSDGTDTTEGFCRQETKPGLQHGFNKMRYCSEAYFEGEMKAGMRTGHGRMWYADGSFYEGHWKADMRDGVGLFVEVNGNRYEGEWQANNKHGYGQFFHLHSGQMQYGLWNHGIPICSVMRDIQFRQACEQPTPYPIPKVEIQNPEKLYADEFFRLSKEQEPSRPTKAAITNPLSPKNKLSPWFYANCCNTADPTKN